MRIIPNQRIGMGSHAGISLDTRIINKWNICLIITIIFDYTSDKKLAELLENLSSKSLVRSTLCRSTYGQKNPKDLLGQFCLSCLAAFIPALQKDPD
jgi:hypothetical protein